MHPYEAKMRRLRQLRLLAIVLGLGWASFMGWREYTSPAFVASEAFSQQRYGQQVKECRGEKTSQRFDCRQELLLERQQNSFYGWTLRVLWVAGPPLVLIWLVTKLATPRRPPPGGAFRERPEPQQKKKPKQDEEP